MNFRNFETFVNILANFVEEGLTATKQLVFALEDVGYRFGQ